MGAHDIFSNMPDTDRLGFFANGKTDYQKVIETMGFKREDISRATGHSLASIRFDDRIPQELQDRIAEWANLYSLVAEHFKDAAKAVLWFKVPNPLLGNITPRDMIRFGRYKKLLKFIQNSLDENVRS